MRLMKRATMSVCREAVTRIPGVDDATMAAVVAMRIRSFGLDEQTGESLADAILNERAQASADYII